MFTESSPYWYLTMREPVKNPPVLESTSPPCENTQVVGCYNIENKQVHIKVPTKDYACTLHHEKLHACGWMHRTDFIPTNRDTYCGWSIPLC